MNLRVYALVRILMHAVKTEPLRASAGFSGGLLPVLPVSRQKRPEGLSQAVLITDVMVNVKTFP